jgi:hypothetical protein
MADGSRKPIDQVEVGDEVIASDPETSEQEVRKVTHVFVHEDTVTDLALKDGTTLGTTVDHPFWSATDGRFERADELAAGEQVLTADGRPLTVDGLRFATSRTGPAYNLEVEGIHTYHVGEQSVLVHNMCGPIWSATKKKNSVQNAFGHWQKHRGDFPELNNSKEYVEAANGFLGSSDPSVLTRVRTNQDIVRFNPNTDEFGVMDPSGVPRTYFKPNPASHGYPTNLDYFGAQ